MIPITRTDGSEAVLNCDHILYVEAVPDTVITLINDERVLVKQSVEEIVERVIAFRRQLDPRR